MFGLNKSYIFALFALAIFGTAFFTVDFYLPKIRVWKSNILFQQSKIYLDETIDNAGGLLDEGVGRGRLAHLLNPSNQEVLLNYIRLRFRTHPAQALLLWSKALGNENDSENRSELLSKCLATLKNEDLTLNDRRISGEIAYGQVNILMQVSEWANNPDNILIFCELLAETGKPEEAHVKLSKLLDEFPLHPQGVFLLARLTVHLKDDSKLIEVGKALASLSAQRNDIGVEAIRHMTLLHLLNPLSANSLQKCIELLNSNPQSKPIDYLRIHALQYAVSNQDSEKANIIRECSKLFDLTNAKELFIYSRWLARLYEFSAILEFLPPSKARVDENLFKIRMNALAQQGELESIHAEVANAPMISTLWRMVIEARAFSLQGKYDESIDVLDRLIPLLGDDPRKVRAVCFYLESSNDIRGLAHILENLIDQSIHRRYALSKLLQHRAGSAPLHKLIEWIEHMSKINPDDLNLQVSRIYLNLLDPSLISPSVNLSKFIEKADLLVSKTNLPQARITLALAHLRNSAPDKALVALGRPEDWRQWRNSRGAWSYIASQIYRLNKDSEKAIILSENVSFAQMDRAEKESLQALFPSQF